MARNPPRPPIPETDANELLRRHFEARFQPIEADGAGAAALCKENVGSSGQSPEWSGLSASSDNDDDDDDDDDNEGRCDAESGDDCDSDDDDDVEMQDEDDITAIEVVDHSAQQTPKQNTTTMSKRELKAFMSSRPPDPNSAAAAAAAARSNLPSSSSSSKALPEDAPSLLAQDLQLRRLLAESHLLAPHHAARKSLSGTASNAAAAAAQEKTFTAGRTRQKATDLRIQALGSKTSILTQRNVPMAIRQGKQATADAREAKRRREARENGIILERGGGGGGAVTKRGSRNKERRKGGGGGAPQVDRPGIGRFKGAELRISERDVRGIEGSRDTFGRRGRR